jgi:ABC-type glycerol-3-phosphate transport system permease component
VNRGNKERIIPLWALLLDVLGAIAVAAGIYALVADTGFRNAGVALIIIGALLMIPLVIVIVVRARNR